MIVSVTKVLLASLSLSVYHTHASANIRLYEDVAEKSHVTLTILGVTNISTYPPPSHYLSVTILQFF